MDLAVSLIADLLGFEVGDAAAIARLRAGQFSVAQLGAIGGPPA